MRNEAPRATRQGQGRLACVGCGAPVGHNSLKYMREMCLRCYARALDGRPVGERDGADPRAREASSDDANKARRG